MRLLDVLFGRTKGAEKDRVETGVAAAAEENQRAASEFKESMKLFLSNHLTLLKENERLKDENEFLSRKGRRNVHGD